MVQFAERCGEYELKIEQTKAQHQREMDAARQELKDLYKEVCEDVHREKTKIFSPPKISEYDQRLQAACAEALQV